MHRQYLTDNKTNQMNLSFHSFQIIKNASEFQVNKQRKTHSSKSNERKWNEEERIAWSDKKKLFFIKQINSNPNHMNK